MTEKEIREAWEWRCPHGHRGLSHWNCWIARRGERLGFIDLECSNLTASFGIILAWCIKEKGKKITSDCITKQDLAGDLDKRIVESCIEAMRGFDKLSGHYSEKFDIPFVRTRALSLGLPFPEYGEIKHVDVWRMAKRLLRLHSNRQEVVSETLHGRSEKNKIKPLIWIRALQGDEGSLAYILNHCKRDVRDLERNYIALEPYARKSNTSI